MSIVFSNKDAHSFLVKGVIHTDAGMLGIWDYSAFEHIEDYDSWDEELCEDEDIIRHIKTGEFVPIELGDGVFGIDIRFGPISQMSDREREYLLVPARPYLLKTKGKVCISGIEQVEKDIGDNTLVIDLPEGKYSVYSNLIDWAQEPGALDENGKPSKDALPDLIIYLDPQPIDGKYREVTETFLKEDAIR